MEQAQPCEEATSKEVEYLDLRGLSVYSSLAVPTLRDYLREGRLPHYKLKGKIIVKKSEFNSWLENYRVDKHEDLDDLVDDVVQAFKS
jgi:hypothetical protein